MRIPVSFDMLDPALCVAWRILKLPLNLDEGSFKNLMTRGGGP